MGQRKYVSGFCYSCCCCSFLVLVHFHFWTFVLFNCLFFFSFPFTLCFFKLIFIVIVFLSVKSHSTKEQLAYAARAPVSQQKSTSTQNLHRGHHTQNHSFRFRRWSCSPNSDNQIQKNKTGTQKNNTYQWKRKKKGKK